MQEAERRVTAVTQADIRMSESTTGLTFSGLAARFNEAAYIGPKGRGFYETIEPGAFAGQLANGSDVRALFNHDPSLLLGRVSAGTLRLTETRDGLANDIDLPDTTAGRDVAALIRRKDITGQSFQFMVSRETWGKMEVGGGSLRTIHEMGSLIDVGPVTFPAYVGTTASVRALTYAAVTQKRDGVQDVGMLAMLASTDACIDAATTALAAGVPAQAQALLGAAAETIDIASYSLYSFCDPSTLKALGLPDIAAMIEAVDSAIDAAIAAVNSGNVDPSVCSAADVATDALMSVLHIADADDGTSLDPESAVETSESGTNSNEGDPMRSLLRIRKRRLALARSISFTERA